MRIRGVRAFWLHVPIPEARQHTSDFGRARTFDTVLVRIDTEDGLTGWGEAKSAVGSDSANQSLVTMVEKELAPLLVGQDSREIGRLWEVMYSGSRAHYALARGHVYPVLGRRGLRISAISGIDTALWDIQGKRLNAPIHQLLGGRLRAEMPAYASGGWAPKEAIGEELLSYVARGGFRAVKMRVGAQDREVPVSAQRVAAARAALGPDIDLMCDAHGTTAEAKRFCRMVAECNLAWFEEPVASDDRRGLAEVRRGTDVPIAAGESEFTRFDFLELAELRAVDIFQPDLAICGGISEAQRIAALAAAYQIRLAPHLWGGAVMFMAGLHVAAAAPAGFILEYSLGANPLLHELTAEKPQVADGKIAIPDRPGLGLTIDEGFVSRYAVG